MRPFFRLLIGAVMLVGSGMWAHADTTPPTVEDMDGDVEFNDPDATISVKVYWSELIIVHNGTLSGRSTENGTTVSIENDDSTGKTVSTISIEADGSGNNIDFQIWFDDVEDLAGNTAAKNFRWEEYGGPSFFVDRPVIMSINAPSTYTGITPFTVTITFDEPAMGLTESGLEVTGAAVGAPAVDVNDANAWTVELTPDGSGEPVTFAVKAGAVTNSAGNSNIASESKIILSEAAPSIELDAANSAGSHDGSAPFQVVFNTVNFDASDDGTINERLVAVTSGGPFGSSTFTVDFTGSVITVTVTPNDTQDLTVTLMEGFWSKTYTAGTTSVTVETAASVPASVPYAPGTFAFTTTTPTEIDFGVYGVYIGMPAWISGPPYSLANGSGATSDGASFSRVANTGRYPDIFASVNLQQSQDQSLCNGITDAGFCAAYLLERTYPAQTIQLAIPAGGREDENGDVNEAFSLTIEDVQVPEVVYITRDDTYTGTAPVTVTIIFNSFVEGLDESGLVVTGADIDSIQSDDNDGNGKEWTVVLTPDGNNNSIMLAVERNAVTDSAGNASVNTPNIEIAYLAPGVPPVLSTTTTEYTSHDQMTVTVNADKEVSGLEQSEIEISNNVRVDELKPADPTAVVTSYEILITPLNSGPIELRIPADAQP